MQVVRGAGVGSGSGSGSGSGGSSGAPVAQTNAQQGGGSGSTDPKKTGTGTGGGNNLINQVRSQRLGTLSSARPPAAVRPEPCAGLLGFLAPRRRDLTRHLQRRGSQAVGNNGAGSGAVGQINALAGGASGNNLINQATGARERAADSPFMARLAHLSLAPCLSAGAGGPGQRWADQRPGRRQEAGCLTHSQQTREHGTGATIALA